MLTLLLLVPAFEWTSWHGRAGVAEPGDVPAEWSADANVRWSAELSGVGASTPCVVGGKVVLTDALGEGGRENGVLCFDLQTGQELWRQTVGELVPAKHKKASGTNPSPTSDGERVFVYFKSGDLAALSLADGSVVWQHSVRETFQWNDKTLWWDLGTSPVIAGDNVVVCVQQTGPSGLLAFDRKTGKVAYQADRKTDAPEEAAQSYTTPLVVEHDGGSQIIVSGADAVTGHEAATGKELWRVGGLNPDQDGYFRSISSSSYENGVVVVPYSRGGTVRAIRLPTGGADPEVLWVREGVGSDVPTPAVRDGLVYVIEDKAKPKKAMSVLDLESGKTVGRVEFPRSRGTFSASPVLAGDRLYATREDGTTFVVDVSDPKRPELVSENSLGRLDGIAVATPVPLGDTLLVRTGGNLWAIGK